MKLLEQPIDGVGNVRRRAFTLVELLVVIGIVMVLVALQLPALAGAKQKTKLMVCLGNLHQIGVASSAYASEFDDYFPPTTVGNANYPPPKNNNLGGIHYTRYILSGNSPDGTILPDSYLPAWNQGTNGMSDENMGYLYAGRFIKDGHIFFCPVLSDALSANADYVLSPNYYVPFMSTRSAGAIRASYMYNPRMVSTSSPARKYQKISDQKALDVFTIDYLAAVSTTFPGAPFNQDNWLHYPGQGLTMLFTDGSAKFCKITNSTLFNAICISLDSSEDNTSRLQYSVIFDSLVASP